MSRRVSRGMLISKPHSEISDFHEGRLGVDLRRRFTLAGLELLTCIPKPPVSLPIPSRSGQPWSGRV
jgi:hypothetical protein